MKKLILMATIVAVAMSSCSKNEISIVETADNAVGFDTYTGIAARGSILRTSDLFDGFGVLAYDQGESTVFGSTNVPNFMYNTKVYDSSSDDSDTWTYDLTKYWATSTTNFYSFFAYAPYSDTSTSNGIELSANNATGAPTITFTLQDYADDMIDLVAGQKMNINKYGNTISTSTEENSGTETTTLEGSSTTVQPVSLNFKHQLTRATFKAVSGFTTPQTFINIKSFRILGTTPTVQESAIPVTGTVKETPYDNKYASTALYSTAVYTFNTDTSTDIDKTVHTQDGTWDYTTTESNGSAVKITEGYNLSSIVSFVASSIGYNEVTSTYNETGVRLQGGASPTPVNLFKDDQYIFLIPPQNKLGVDDTNIIQVELVYDIVTVDDSVDGDHTINSTNNFAIVKLTEGTLEQGYAYEYTFTISGSASYDPTDSNAESTANDAVTISGTMIEWDETDTYDDGEEQTTAENVYPIDAM